MLHFKLYHPKCSLGSYTDTNTQTLLTLYLSPTGCQFSLPHPKKQKWLFLGVSQMCLRSSPALVSPLKPISPRNYWWDKLQERCCSPGYSPCVLHRNGKILLEAEDWVQSGYNKLLSSTACAQLAQVPLSKRALGFYSQPRDLSGSHHCPPPSSSSPLP